MKYALLLLTACMLSLGTAEALLAPFEQSVREIETIMESEEMRNLLGPSQSILAIEKNKEGYLITTSDYTLQVDLEYQYWGRIGPADFKLTFKKPAKKTN